MMTHNFASIGSRSTGNEGGSFLIAGPSSGSRSSWSGSDVSRDLNTQASARQRGSQRASDYNSFKSSGGGRSMAGGRRH